MIFLLKKPLIGREGWKNPAFQFMNVCSILACKIPRVAQLFNTRCFPVPKFFTQMFWFFIALVPGLFGLELVPLYPIVDGIPIEPTAGIPVSSQTIPVPACDLSKKKCKKAHKFWIRRSERGHARLKWGPCFCSDAPASDRVVWPRFKEESCTDSFLYRLLHVH